MRPRECGKRRPDAGGVCGRWLLARIALAILLVGATVAPVCATTVPFAAKQVIDGSFDGALSVSAADLDGDGDLDLLGAASVDDDVTWWENTAGDASAWSKQTIDGSFDGASSAAAADIDGDGDLDVLATADDAGQIAWWRNAPGDGFEVGKRTVASGLSGEISAYAADIDGDGDLDVLGASDVKVAWWENTVGDGSAWTEHSFYSVPAGNEARSVSAADIDGDGDLDVLACSSGGKITWWQNLRIGTAWAEHTVDSGLGDVGSVRAADVDGDGDLDVVGGGSAVSSSTRWTHWWENTAGDGSAWLEHLFIISNGVRWVKAADLDGDGDIDVLGAAPDSDQILWYENVGGDAREWAGYNVATAFDGARSVDAADIDGDGDLDVLGAATDADDIAWWENETIHRSATFPSEHLIEGNFSGAAAVYSADIDGDGDEDVLAAASDAGDIVWWESTAAGWSAHDVDTSFAGATSVYAADVDRDGDLDVVGAGFDADEIAWWANVFGDGSRWSKQTVTSSFDGARSVVAADVDGDGDVDIAGAAQNAGDIAWWENSAGDGTLWTEHVVDSTFSGASSVYAADIDRDGDLDVLATAQTASDVTWWENTGSDGSTWSEHTINASFSGVRSVYPADVDGDGDLDVLAAAFVADDVMWWENDGSGGGWSGHTVDGNFDGAWSVYATDLDGDGDLDVLAAADTADDVAWWENTTGDGDTWKEHTIDDNFNGARAVTAADLDADGDLDVLGAAVTGNDITWWENRGGQFALATTQAAPAMLQAGDAASVLTITMSHRGRSGDSDEELATLELLFDDGAGTALTSAEAEALINALYVYRDNGSGSFDAAGDTLVTTVSAFVLTNGVATVSFTDGDPNLQRSYGGQSTFFVVVQTALGGGAAVPHTFRMTHVTEASSTAQDASADIGLVLEYVANVSAGIVEVVECGDGVLQSGEQCDDGGTADGDCCSASCAFEASGSACGDSADKECTAPDTCDGAGICQSNDQPAGAPCGDQGVQCRPDDACDGSGGCADAGFSPVGTACGSTADTECSDPDGCDGAGTCSANDEPQGSCGDGAEHGYGTPFSTTTSIATGFDGARSLHAADIDGDGDLDVVGAAEDAGDVVWWENTAADADSWAAHTIDGSAGGPRSVHAADVDGDGAPDVVATSSDQQILWWKNMTRTGGTWSAAQVIGSDFTGATAAIAADLDGDGDADVLGAADAAGTVAWWENTAAAASAWTKHTIDAAFSGARAVDAADVDGDGDLDVLGAAAVADDVAWWENTAGDGSRWSRHTIAGDFDSAAAVHAADIDGDGDVDVVAATGSAHTVRWWENTVGDGSVWTEHDVDTAFAGGTAVYAADLDQDGDLDLIGTAERGDEIAWWENRLGDGSAWSKHALDQSYDGAFSAYAADLDGDGDLDVLGAARVADAVSWWRNQTIHRSAVFPFEQTIDGAFFGAASVHAADVDGDGDVDVVGGANTIAAWWENTGDGRVWAAHTVGVDVTHVHSVYVADIDADGDMDVLGAIFTDNEVLWWENTAGDGSAWSEHTVSASFNDANSVRAADVDGDGDPDVLGAAVGGDVVWWENTTGDGSAWSEHTVDGQFGGAYDVHAADMDGDGDVDILGVASAADDITWWENTLGDGSAWSEHTIVDHADAPFGVFAADIDGDGDLDVLSALFVADDIAWWENTAGDGSAWASHLVDGDFDGAWSVFATDIDGDGDVDVLGAASNADDLTWWENAAGDGSTWNEHAVAGSFDGARSVFATDVDGDGDVDVLGAASRAGDITWWENRGGQFALTTTDTAPAILAVGDRAAVLSITESHRGRGGDSDIELATLELLFDDGAGTVLSPAQANALIENLYVYRDDGSTVFEPSSDVLVATVTGLDLEEGLQTVALADDDPNVQTSHRIDATFFVLVEAAAGAQTAVPETFRITHVTEASSTAEDALADFRISLEYAVNVASGAILVQGALTATPTETATATPTETSIATVTPEPTGTATATVTPAPTATTVVPTATMTVVPTGTGTSTPTAPPTATATETPTGTPADTATANPTETATASPTDTPAETETETATTTPTDPPTTNATATVSATDAPTTTPTEIPTRTATETSTRSPTEATTVPPTQTPTSTASERPTATVTDPPLPSPTPTTVVARLVITTARPGSMRVYGKGMTNQPAGLIHICSSSSRVVSQDADCSDPDQLLGTGGTNAAGSFVDESGELGIPLTQVLELGQCLYAHDDELDQTGEILCVSDPVPAPVVSPFGGILAIVLLSLVAWFRLGRAHQHPCAEPQNAKP